MCASTQVSVDALVIPSVEYNGPVGRDLWRR
jgi:hypothetical protein